MKSIIRIPILFLAALTILLLAGCVPFSVVSPEDGLVMGQPYTLRSMETLNNDLTVIGANATLEKDSTVNGDVAIIGGTAVIDGTINGDISIIGSDVSLGDEAVVHGSVETITGTLHRAEGATIVGGSVTTDNPIPRITTLRTPAMQVSVDPVTAPLMAMFQALALAALAVVLNLFAPAPMERAGRTAMTVPAASGGVGCLTILVLLVMAITIILLPISILGFIAVSVAALFGWLAIGLLVGRQIAILLKQNWTEPVNAGVGTLVITLLASLLNVIPCIGWLGSAALSMIALGAAILTRFGTQVYPSPYAPMPVSQPRPRAQPQTGERVYPPESDMPGEVPPAGPEESNDQ